MSHQGTDGHTGSALNHQDLKRALDWLLSSASLSDLKFRQDCTWTPRGLIFAAILWAWSDAATLTGRFALARKVVIAMAVLPGRPAGSYQAFLKMLRTWGVALAIALVAAFRRRMQADLGPRFEVCGFRVFGVDGSRLGLPRTKSNQQRYCPPATRRRAGSKRRRAAARHARSRASRARRARQKKADSPQMWLTTMFHVGTGLPWDWRVGPSDSSEREHLKQMIDALPEGALVTADAGFVGYDYWAALLRSGRHLLIRVGANVRLLRGLGYAQEKGGRVYLWPDREAAKGRPPLVLRLVVARGGRHPVYLVTSVLEPARLSDREVATIYSLRWGIELFYRHFKQTYGRRKLLSHTADNAELEATWSLLGLWAMSLHAQVELAGRGVPARRMSVAGVLRAYRDPLRAYNAPADPGESLIELVHEAVIDDYQRTDKSSRDYPRQKHSHATAAPEVRNATKDQINAARQIRNQLPLGLTA